MIYEMNGVVTFVDETKSFQGANGTFTKRAIWIAPIVFDEATQTSLPRDGKYSVAFESTKEKTSLLDDYKPGDTVKVKFTVNGRVVTNRAGGQSCFNSLTLWSIAPVQGVIVTNAPGGVRPAENFDTRSYVQQGTKVQQAEQPQPTGQGNLFNQGAPQAAPQAAPQPQQAEGNPNDLPF